VEGRLSSEVHGIYISPELHQDLGTGNGADLSRAVQRRGSIDRLALRK